MARISSAITGIERRLLNSLALANAQITLSNLRMATGHEINSAGDDPAAFVTLSGLESQLGGVTAALANVTAAGSMIAQTQTALTSIVTQLNTIRTELLKDEDHGLSEAERAEAQANIDAAIDQINLLAGRKINGKTLLGGAADYFYSGRNSSQVADIVAHGTLQSGTSISGTVTSTATQAELTYTGDASNQFDLTEETTFTLSGSRGGIVLTVNDGDLLSTVATTINDNSHDTGVTAAVNEVNHTLTFTSVDYGSNAEVNIAFTTGSFVVSGGDGEGHDTGTNAEAVINGITIESDSNKVSGNRFSLNSSLGSFEIEFQADFTGAFDTITVEGNALSFVLTTQVYNKATLAIPSVFAANLSGPSGRLNQLYTGGSLAGLDNNTSQAIRVVDEALGKLTRIQGDVDGFYNAAISSSSELLSDMQTNLEDSIDSIDEVDDDAETERINYYEALASNAVSGLAIVNQQRMYIVRMLQDIAGLI